jgi:uncharacterized iron-regulated membrane protein
MAEEISDGMKRAWYRWLWRLHFYAGLFCLPFILWLAVTGTIYLFQPQIEAMIDRPYDHLEIHGEAADPARQVEAALAAVPGSFLGAYELPQSSQAAVRVLVKSSSDTYRVYVHPQNLQILKIVSEDSRFMRLIFQLHGELLLGDKGSMIVELAASWTIVLLLSGLFLWWPRDRQGLAGVLYPRMSGNRRQFWRDIHAVTGIWITTYTLFLLVSGLPWAKSWGGLLKEVRSWNAAAPVHQDWSTSHAEHLAHQPQNTKDSIPADVSVLRTLIHTVAPLQLAPPVLLSPPTAHTTYWIAHSESQNRPLRVTLNLAATGEILKRENFSDKPLLDRAVGTGVAMHEGQLFGWPNQLLGLCTTLGLILMSISAVVMWWRRRPAGTLGAPSVGRRPDFSGWALLGIAVLGTVLPLLGISLLMLIVVEFTVLRRISAARQFLGLSPP